MPTVFCDVADMRGSTIMHDISSPPKYIVSSHIEARS